MVYYKVQQRRSVKQHALLFISLALKVNFATGLKKLFKSLRERSFRYGAFKRAALPLLLSGKLICESEYVSQLLKLSALT